MIKYYDTLAAYEADVKSNFESQVSLIGADNTVKYDGRNVVIDIRSARTGTIAVLDGTHALRFISVDTFSSESFMSNFEIVGVVVVGVDHPSFRGQISIMYHTPQSKKLLATLRYKLTGYTLDGTDRTGTLSIREKSDRWAANHDYVISYNATDESTLVNQLNTYFKANEPFKTQKWSAYLNEDNTTNLPAGASGSGVNNVPSDGSTLDGINLSCMNFGWQQSYNKGKDGFTLSSIPYDNWPFPEKMLRINGNRGGYGAIMNWARAIDYYRKDNGAEHPYMGGRTTDQGSNTKQQYPINLPTWLGTSTQNPGDFCAGLRAIYGEGETGWLKFMKTMLPVRPTEYGANGDKVADVYNITYYLASQKYVDVDGNIHAISPAADFVANIGFDHELLKKGRWVIPNMDLFFDVIENIEYPIINDRNTDIINKALLAIGAPAISNGAYSWFCYNNWHYNGSTGCSMGEYGTYMPKALNIVPLVILDVPQGLNSNK